jgi:hypothetical protein
LESHAPEEGKEAEEVTPNSNRKPVLERADLTVPALF